MTMQKTVILEMDYVLTILFFFGREFIDYPCCIYFAPEEARVGN